MTLKILIPIMICCIFFACQNNDEKLEDIYSDIRNSPQIKDPSKSDKKLNSIKKLRSVNNDATPDSLQSFFYDIDTTLRGHYIYQYEILEILAELNSEKSLKIYADIIGNFPLNMPGNMFFIWDMQDRTENAQYLFPELAKALENQMWIDDEVLSIIINGYKRGHLTKDDLLSSKPFLIDFYNRLKIERDSLPGRKYYNSFYTNHLSDLIRCLQIFGNEPKLNEIYQETLFDNLSFADFHNNNRYSDYYNESIPRLEILRQASLSLIRNEQEVESKYINKIMIDPLNRLTFYRELRELNKDSILSKNHLSQYCFAESDLIHTMNSIPDGGIPENLRFIKKRTIESGEHKGNYYFFNTIWNFEDTLTIYISVSGPQPLNENEIVEHGELANSYIGEVNRANLDEKINKFIDKFEN